MIKKENRLRKRTEFAYSFTHANKRTFSNLVTLVIYKRTDKRLRIGFSVSKKIGKSVERNRVKRQMRASVQNLLKSNLVAKGYNLIFIAKEEIKGQSYIEIEKNIKLVLKKGEVYNLVINGLNGECSAKSN